MSSSFTSSGPTGSLRQGGTPDGPPLAPIPVGNTFEVCPDRPIGSLRQGGRNTFSTSFEAGRGAGRSREFVYPAPNVYIAPGDAGLAGLSRFGYEDSQMTAFAQNPGGAAVMYYKGRVCFKATAQTGMVGTMGPAIPFAALKGGAPQRGQFHCWRVKAILAAEPNAADRDIGIALMHGSDTGVHGDVRAGMILRPRADNSIDFAARAVAFGPLTLSDVMPITTLVAEWNCYEFRIIGATAVQDAQLKILINNQVQATYSFGDGLLPFDELQVMCGVLGGGIQYMPIGGLCVAAAYDEASLL